MFLKLDVLVESDQVAVLRNIAKKCARIRSHFHVSPFALFPLSSSFHLFLPCAMSCMYVVCVNRCMSCFPIFCFCELTLIQPCLVFLMGKHTKRRSHMTTAPPALFLFRSLSSLSLSPFSLHLCRCENEILYPCLLLFPSPW